jgi:hypothetical protein
VPSRTRRLFSQRRDLEVLPAHIQSAGDPALRLESGSGQDDYKF